MKHNKKEYKMWERTLSLRGGSYNIVIPEEVKKHIDVSDGEQVCILTIPGKKALIGKKDSFDLKSSVKINGEDFGIEVMRSLFDEDDIKEIIDMLQEEKEKQ